MFIVLPCTHTQIICTNENYNKFPSEEYFIFFYMNHFYHKIVLKKLSKMSLQQFQK